MYFIKCPACGHSDFILFDLYKDCCGNWFTYRCVYCGKRFNTFTY